MTCVLRSCLRGDKRYDEDGGEGSRYHRRGGGKMGPPPKEEKEGDLSAEE